MSGLKLGKSNEQWRVELAPELYDVARCGGTERAILSRSIWIR
jgi:hypothetical protein